AAVHVRSGEPREFALFVYNVAPEELAWETNVADSNGTEHPVMTKLLQETHGTDVTKLVLQYAPDDRDSAPERLDVTIHKKGSSDERKVSVPITLLRPKGEIR
ncbi:MAG TPA: hypothetical protein VJ853_09610, partial [Thermoanaerobaculia bacterium]|nr:hypothetical protein [Thermoanaerobaculia bacterium]